jgi:hypothetical protein
MPKVRRFRTKLHASIPTEPPSNASVIGVNSSSNIANSGVILRIAPNQFIAE